MRALQDFLLAKHAENRRVVLFIEEAQSMPMPTLEEVRLLSNLETGQDKLMQIVLFGQPELEDTLSRHEIRQLKERITHTFPLTPFQRWEIRDYLNSRLRACGFRGGEVFGPSAVREIETYSAGLVRRINIIADKSMLAAYAEQAMSITPKHVRMAAKDSEYRPQRRFPAWAGMAAAGVLLLAVAGTLYWLYAGRGDTGGPTDTATDSPPRAASPTAGSDVAGSGQGPEAAQAAAVASSGQNAPQPGTSRADEASGMASSASAPGPAASP